VEDARNEPEKVGDLTLSAGALICLLAIGNSLAAARIETWHLDRPHCAAQFAVRHLEISTLRGTFTRVNGDVQYFAADPSKSAFDVTIDAPSWDTPVEMRDNDRPQRTFPGYCEIPDDHLQVKARRGSWS
jgi:polyisoprenoid-binding protein YceI